MMLRPLIYCVLFTSLIACKNNNGNPGSPVSEQRPATPAPGTDVVDNNFSSFIDKFSTDTAFQLQRTKYPLKIRQYDIDIGKDTILYQQPSEFEKMDFRKKRSGSGFNQWKQEIVVDKNENNAIIQIRGIENGIMVDYYFEKKNGRWMLVSVEDSST
jgi:hypothetical protein